MGRVKYTAKKMIILLILSVPAIFSCKMQIHAEEKKITRVSVILPHADDGYWELIENGIHQSYKELKEKCGMDINMIMPQLNYNVPQMVELLKQQIAAKVDVLVVQGNENEEYIQTLKEAMKQGIQIICVDTDIESLPEHLYIGTDNYEAGKLIGTKLAEITGGKAKTVVISGQEGFSNLEERLNGLQDAVKDYPGIELGDVQYDNYDGLTVMKLYYQYMQDADAVVFLEGTGGITLSRQFRGRDGGYQYVLGFDAFQGVESGALDGVVKQDTRGMGEHVVKEIANAIQNGAYSADAVYTEISWLTSENYKTILSKEELDYAEKQNSGGAMQ